MCFSLSVFPYFLIGIVHAVTRHVTIKIQGCMLSFQLQKKSKWNFVNNVFFPSIQPSPFCCFLFSHTLDTTLPVNIHLITVQLSSQRSKCTKFYIRISQSLDEPFTFWHFLLFVIFISITPLIDVGELRSFLMFLFYHFSVAFLANY
jgi:hypothetical protein